MCHRLESARHTWQPRVARTHGPHTRPLTGPWSDVVGCRLDLVFIVDLLVQFFVAYPVDDALGGRSWVLDRAQIRRKYMRTWFPLDVFTTVGPLSIDLYVVSQSEEEASPSSTSGDLEKISVVRVLRVVRLLKLLRLLRGTRVFERWKSRISLTHSQTTIATAVVALATGIHCPTPTRLQSAPAIRTATHIVTHSPPAKRSPLTSPLAGYACVFALQASLHTDIEDTWVAGYSLCDTQSTPPGAPPPPRLGTGPLPGCRDLDTWALYVMAAAWSALAITGTGGSDIYPSSRSKTETAIACGLILIGALFWTTILAAFCDITTNSNPGQTHFRQRLDALNQYIAINQLRAPLATAAAPVPSLSI
jgi:hypothetical protein